MPSEILFPFLFVHSRLENGCIVTEPMLAPEFSRLGNYHVNMRDNLQEMLTNYLETLDAGELHKYRQVKDARVRSVNVEIKPAKKTNNWTKPIHVKLPAIVWKHPDGYRVYRVPALKIEVILHRSDKSKEILPGECLAAMQREKWTADLKALSQLQIIKACKIEKVKVVSNVRTLKEFEKKVEPREKSVLNQVAYPIRNHEAKPAYCVDESIKQLLDALQVKPLQSVLLIGPSGVGKTAVLRELIRSKKSLELDAPRLVSEQNNPNGDSSTRFFQSSGARIVAGQTGFGMWEQRCQDLVREAAKEKVILCLGSLVELNNVGRSEYNTTSIASYLRPYIARGDFQCVVECTPEQFSILERTEPQLVDAFRQIRIEEPDEARGRAILKAFNGDYHRRNISDDALATVDRLHRRFASYSGYPGRPIRFLENRIQEGERHTLVENQEVYTAFSRETGLPDWLLNPAISLDLEKTEKWFSSRVIGQEEAVKRVVDLLATIKAGLSRPNRPIASLLFVGPTGVGKTEMAKSIAEFLFGSKDRLTRFDMSEFGDPVSVRRLIGTAFGQEGLLTAKIREQPFSVILLDEVEKADPSMFDLLLQALGEARMTDAAGRLADFRNTIVILTSNLGAESFQTNKLGFGESGSLVKDAQAHFTKAVESKLRPEMVNRLDRIVSFDPLGKEIIRLIAQREWAKVLNRDGVRFRNVNMKLEDEVLSHISQVGFHPKYGARPLQRAMERQMLAPLASEINRFTDQHHLEVNLSLKDNQPVIEAKQQQDEGEKVIWPIKRLCEQARDQRRWNQLLETSSVARSLTNEIFELEYRMKESRGRRRKDFAKPLTPEQQIWMAELGRLNELNQKILSLRQKGKEFEEDFLERFYREELFEKEEIQKHLNDNLKLWDQLLFDVYMYFHKPKKSITLMLHSEHPTELINLSEAYMDIAYKMGLKVEARSYLLLQDELTQIPSPKEKTQEESYWYEDFLVDSKTNRAAMKRANGISNSTYTIAVAIFIEGNAAHIRFGYESGLHRFPFDEVKPTDRPVVWLASTNESLTDVRPKISYLRKGALPSEPICRNYTYNSQYFKRYGVASLEEKITQAIRERLIQMVLE